MRYSSTLLSLLVLLFACAPSDQEERSTQVQVDFSASTHTELVNFFFDWREFHNPEMKEGVPDYSKSAMDLQYAELATWQAKLDAFDTAGWSIEEQIDWYLVWAEMNGLDFAHRVKQPWFRDPAFYVWFYPGKTDVPEREGPNIHGNIEYAYFDQPLSAEDAASIATRLQSAPALYEQAKKNLTGNAKDLWITGTRSIREQSENLERLAISVESDHPQLAMAAREAIEASNDLATWLEGQSTSKTGTSGVGKDNYSWNLQKVHLLPYSWRDEEVLMRRELHRSHASLRLEEQRNKDLPKLEKITDPEEYDRLFNAAIDEYLEFFEKADIVPIKDYMEPALRARVNKFVPFDGIRGFFAEIGYRDPIIMRTHDYHWIDLARMREEPHPSPIRATPLLYNIFDSRAEGMATGMEEMMMHAGFLDDKPRSRELIWILLAQRAARGLAGLYQHGLELDFDGATKFASKWTPWGLLPADGGTIQHEEQFYLRQPAYGTSYNIGKLEVEKIIAEYARQRNGEFSMSEFMDEFNKCGMIPTSLVYWQMTGDKSLLNEALNMAE